MTARVQNRLVELDMQWERKQKAALRQYVEKRQRSDAILPELEYRRLISRWKTAFALAIRMEVWRRRLWVSAPRYVCVCVCFVKSDRGIALFDLV